MSREVSIDQTKIIQMMNNPALVAFLPALQSLSKKGTQKKSCGCKGASKKAALNFTYADRDSALRELSAYLTGNPSARTELKRRLGADVLRVKYKKLGEKMMVVNKL